MVLSPEKITAIYCIIDDILKSAGHKSDKRAKLSDSEILTLCMVAMLQYDGIYIYALNDLYNHSYISSKICKSRLYRRIEILSILAENLFEVISSFFTDVAAQKEFIIDSTPIEVCDNIRIKRCKLLRRRVQRLQSILQKILLWFETTVDYNAAGNTCRLCLYRSIAA